MVLAFKIEEIVKSNAKWRISKHKIKVINDKQPLHMITESDIIFLMQE